MVTIFLWTNKLFEPCLLASTYPHRNLLIPIFRSFPFFGVPFLDAILTCGDPEGTPKDPKLDNSIFRLYHIWNFIDYGIYCLYAWGTHHDYPLVKKNLLEQK